MDREQKEAGERDPEDPEEDVEDLDEWWRLLQDGGPVYGVDRPTAKKRRKEPEKADSSVQRALSCDGNESECRKLLRKLS